MDELSEVWYSGYHRRPITHSSRQLKTAIAITVLILCGLVMVVIGVTTNSLQMKTGGYTMCAFGLIAAICLFWWRHFKRKATNASQRSMQRNESSLTHSVEFIELILRERHSSNNSETQTNNLTSSRREINFLLTRMIGYPPPYEEVTTNDDINEVTTQAQCPPPPCYTDEDTDVDVNLFPPSYESVARGSLSN
ncbi:uncharacterized protein LOC144652386 [Oculina patagonica]